MQGDVKIKLFIEKGAIAITKRDITQTPYYFKTLRGQYLPLSLSLSHSILPSPPSLYVIVELARYKKQFDIKSDFHVEYALHGLFSN